MKKPFKKLKKAADKVRKQKGLTNDVDTHGFTVQPEHLEQFRTYLQSGIALDHAVNVIRRVKNGIPENLDKRCIQATGMRVQELNNFYMQWNTRMAMSLGAKTKEENIKIMTGYHETVVAGGSGKAKDGVMVIPREEYDKYIQWFDLFRKNPEQCCEFVGDIFSYANTLVGSGK